MVCSVALLSWFLLAPPPIVLPAAPSFAEQVAARELQRYVYVRAGEVLPITQAGEHPFLVLVTKDQPLLRTVVPDEAALARLARLGPDEYQLVRWETPRGAVQLVVGGDDNGLLYGAYRLAEHYGVRAYLHGDTIADGRVALADLPRVTERGKPLFALRGIQPFHDFPEGPDWWNADDYKAILAQLPKMGMNFLGLHTYPEGVPAEPTVWIGLPQDLRPDGSVAASYPSSYQNTLRNSWGYQGRPSGTYHCGADLLFERDDFGAPVMWGRSPQPTDPDECNALFGDTGAMLREAFPFGRALGVKTCVGTETPLTIPAKVRERLVALGKNPDDPAVRRELYEGIFRRAAEYPIDTYWFWTPEGWTWSGTTPEQVQATLDDLDAAFAAHKAVGSPFGLATCGWVLGPQYDRSLFDNTLPPGVAVSCINREVGRAPVEPGFAQVTREGKWAIPWLEDDPTLTTAQLWAGRMRQDAVDAHTYGCNGLMGIHWRTRVLAMNASALAQAAWRQGDWGAPHEGAPELREGPLGGQVANYAQSQFADTEDDVLYQTVRYNLSGYQLMLPNGRYTLTLRFCEPHYDAAAMRVFDVSVQGQKVIDRLDVFERVGKNRALDCRYESVEVKDGWLRVGFGYQTEFPCIAALEIEGEGIHRGINCGGPAVGIFATDPEPLAGAGRRGLDALDYYVDWANVEFGPKAGPAVGELFARLDGRFPMVSTWTNGPGGLIPDTAPWETVREQFDFVDELERLGELATSAGDRERYGYWLAQFRYTRAQAKVRCLWGALNAALDKVRAEADPQAKGRLARETALPARVALVEAVAEVYDELLATVTSTGELGTVMNWETHILPGVLLDGEAELAALLGEPLPADARLGTSYRGPLRLVALNPRTSIVEGESLRLRAIALAPKAAARVTLHWRTLGERAYRSKPIPSAGRGVYLAELTPAECGVGGVEWYLEAVSEGATVTFPATAPERGETLSLLPPADGRR